jgi:hypothetical protein
MTESPRPTNGDSTLRIRPHTPRMVTMAPAMPNKAARIGRSIPAPVSM